MFKSLFVSRKDVKAASTKSAFTKYDSMLVKGVAIVLLMFHHCISKSATRLYDIDFFPLKSSIVALGITNSFKLCVGMFVFVTGYGLYKSLCATKLDAEGITHWTGKRLIKSLSGFWLIYVLTFIITTIVDDRPFSVYITNARGTAGWVYAVIDFLGLAKLFRTPSLIGTWWYMSAVIVFIVLIPFVFKIGERFGYFAISLMVVILPRLFCGGFLGSKSAFSFMLALVLGMVFAKHDLFKKITELQLCKSKALSDIIQFGIYLIGFYLIYFVYKISRAELWELNFSISAVIVICFSRKFLSNIPVLSSALMVIGKHSLNIFLVHTFIRYVYFMDELYSIKYAILIPFVLLAISFAISVVIEIFKSFIHYDKWFDKLCERL